MCWKDARANPFRSPCDSAAVCSKAVWNRSEANLAGMSRQMGSEAVRAAQFGARYDDHVLP
jgi:hypothetical protein